MGTMRSNDSRIDDRKKSSSWVKTQTVTLPQPLSGESETPGVSFVLKRANALCGWSSTMKVSMARGGRRSCRVGLRGPPRRSPA